jgi:multidrug efflux pump subunit AcrA (membrane-fusion protein)
MDQQPPQTQLRSGLQFSPQQQQGKSFVVVKDPLTSRYFRFTESQAAILELLREPVDAETLAYEASKKLNATIPVATIEALLRSLEEKWLLDTPAVQEKLATVESHKLQTRNVLYLKLLSANPEKIFDWLAPRTRWAFTQAFHVFGVISIGIGLLLSYIHWQDIRSGVEGLFTLHGLLFLWLVTFAVTTMHEFAHGLTCYYFGGKVREVGFMLIYFQPAFYCDVSDSWMFPSKRQRMWVTFAGGYFQLIVWGVCMMLWRVTDPHASINQIVLTVIVYAGLQTLFNLNPLIKLDGYYMLSDYLEIPNLRTKAFQSLWTWVAGTHPSARPWKTDRPQLLYGMASMAFSTTLLIYVYAALYTWATSRFAFAGLVGFAMFSTFTLRRTALESIAGLRAVATRAISRKYIYFPIFAAAVLFLFVFDMQLRIGAPFKVLALNEVTVRTETEGIIVEMPGNVREGSRVSKNDVIARLRDFEKQQTLSELKGALAAKQSELALLRAGARPEELDRKQKLVETKRIEVANARRNEEQRNQLAQQLERKRTELQLDQQTLKRTLELVAGGVAPRVDLDKAQNAVQVREKEIAEIEAAIRVVTEIADRESDLKEREFAEAESELRLMKAGSRPESIRQVQADIAKLSEKVTLLDQELEKTEIRAPIDGIVTTPFVERKLNQHLNPGDEVARLVDISRVTVEMYVPEQDIADVRPGNVVLIQSRSVSSEDLTPAGNQLPRVDFIAPVAQAINGRQMVVVRSEVQNDDLLLKPETTGFAKIETGRQLVIASHFKRAFVRWLRTEFWHILP